MKSAALLLLAGLAGLAGICAAANRPQDNPEVQRLEAALKTSSNRDSTRLLLALAYRNTGTVEGRIHALAIFDQLRRAYYKDPHYHMEMARTFIEGQRVSEGRDELARAYSLDPTNFTAYLDSARLLWQSVLRYSDAGMAREALTALDHALALKPSDRDALFLKSLYLSLLHDLDPPTAADGAVAGRACTERILGDNPKDVSACLLQAVHCLNLADPDLADTYFRLGLGAASDEVKLAYYYPTYSAPDTLLLRLASLSPERRMTAVTAYWESIDPTPLTTINEALLEYWKRMTLADLYYGEPDRRIRGWHTPRGEVLVRYGQPRVIRFLSAGFDDLEAPATKNDVQLERRMGSQHHIALLQPIATRMKSPTQSWEYSFGGQIMQIAFVDQSLNGEFTPASPGALRSIQAEIPSAPLGAVGWDVKECYVGGAGVRGAGGKTRQSVFVDIPRWSRAKDWWKDATVRVRLLSAPGDAETLLNGEISPDVIEHPVADGELAVLSGETSVRPGRYTVAVDFLSKIQGSFVVPLEVRRFAGDSLQMSDLRLNITGWQAGADEKRNVPDPGGLVAPGNQLEVLFELYNLKLDASGQAHYRIRYTLVPRTYALSYMRAVETGGAAPDLDVRLGHLGAALGGVTLSEENYKDVLFPENLVSVSEQATGRLAFRVDSSGLDPGEYALIVTVTDAVSGRWVVDQVPLHVLTREDLQQILRGE